MYHINFFLCWMKDEVHIAFQHNSIAIFIFTANWDKKLFSVVCAAEGRERWNSHDFKNLIIIMNSWL